MVDNDSHVQSRCSGRLKAYIDHVARAGQPFRTDADGSFTGLLTGKKLTVIVASVGEYTPGSPIGRLRPYLKRILFVIGVTGVTFIQAGSLGRVV
jgi:FMN-dependent NADH-azoreductase